MKDGNSDLWVLHHVVDARSFQLMFSPSLNALRWATVLFLVLRGGNWSSENIDNFLMITIYTEKYYLGGQGLWKHRKYSCALILISYSPNVLDDEVLFWGQNMLIALKTRAWFTYFGSMSQGSGHMAWLPPEHRSGKTITMLLVLVRPCQVANVSNHPGPQGFQVLRRKQIYHCHFELVETCYQDLHGGDSLLNNRHCHHGGE